jgi:hypothetical protein
MKKARVGFYGTSNRMINAFLPVSQKLKEHIEMVCIGGRTEEKVQKLANQYHLPGYTDIDKMLTEHKLDFVCNILSCTANYVTTSKMAPHGISCILETPIEFDLGKARGLIELTKKYSVNIEIAENSFRQPEERIAKKLLDTGMFGKVLIAYNDICRHGYHGMNGLRNYIGFDVEPKSVLAMHESFAGPGNDRSNGIRLGFIQFANSAIGVHSRAYGVDLLPLSIRKMFVAENGWLAVKGGEVRKGKKTQQIRIKRINHRIGKVETCKKIIATIGSGKEITWENPFANLPFSDDEISVASVLMSMKKAVLQGVSQEYALKDALADYEIDSAMCSSHLNGKRISFPLDYNQIAQERNQNLY